MPASESTRPPQGAPRSAARLRARRNARGLRAALAKVGESLAPSSAAITSRATVNEITAVIASQAIASEVTEVITE